MSFEQVILRRLAVAVAQQLPSGVMDLKLEAQMERIRHVGEHLVVQLRAYVLTEKAGPVQEDFTVRDVAVFPWWIPKWLRRRWTKTETFTLSVQPAYAYPSSSLKVPDIGEPVRIAIPSALSLH